MVDLDAAEAEAEAEAGARVETGVLILVHPRSEVGVEEEVSGAMHRRHPFRLASDKGSPDEERNALNFRPS